MLSAPQPLADHHQLASFDSGEPSLDGWPGGREPLVHAISEQARRFNLSRGFIESPVQPMTLCLMLATVDRALREP